MTEPHLPTRAENSSSDSLSPAPAPLKDSKLVRRIVNAVIQANTAVLADQYVAEILSEVSALSPQPPTSEPRIEELLRRLRDARTDFYILPVSEPLNGEELDLLIAALQAFGSPRPLTTREEK